MNLVKLPKALQNHPFLQQVYGTVEWSVRAIHAGYVGWFSGNPLDLHPISKQVSMKVITSRYKSYLDIITEEFKMTYKSTVIYHPTNSRNGQKK